MAYRIVKSSGWTGEAQYHAEYRGWFPIWSGLLDWGVTNGRHPHVRATPEECITIIETHRKVKASKPGPVVIWSAQQ